MNIWAILQSIKYLAEGGKFFYSIFFEDKKMFCGAAIFATMVLFIVNFSEKLENQESARHYQDVLRDSYIYRKISESLRTCGDKSSIMIGVISKKEKVGIIKDFYSCDKVASSNCIINTKEKRAEYRESYIVDDATYEFLKDLGTSNQVISVDLNSGLMIDSKRQRRQLPELITLHKLLETSDWYKNGLLKTLKLTAIVDKNQSVIFTLSFTNANECIESDAMIADLREIINQTREKNAIHLF